MTLRLILVNPNTNETTTRTMTRLAQAAAGDRAGVEGVTAPYGVPLITEPMALARAAEAVLALAPSLAAAAPDGVIVAAFGDPGLMALRRALPCPVTGIAEAAMAAASLAATGERGRRFAVATTTPDLVGSITGTAAAYGHGGLFRGVVTTPGDPAMLMADPAALLDALRRACEACIAALGAEAVIIGGGPLGEAARDLAPLLPVPVIAPIPAAVALALERAKAS